MSMKNRVALGMLTLVYLVNFLDRGLVGLLLEPIGKDLQLSDTQLGFLTGIAFALFYATIGVPIARWADRGNRVTIASLALTLWAAAVMACLLVSSFVQLLLARIAAAVGEAGGMPPTYSLVGDYFPKADERARAMSIYLLGGPLSSVVSFMLGGWLNEQVGWRMTFLLMGVPGLLVAIALKLTVKDPRPPPTHNRSESPTMLTVLRGLATQRTSRHLTIGIILLWTLGLGMAPWYAAFMIRSHGMATGELGVWLGGVFGVGGIIGLLSGGVLTARLFPGDERGQLQLSAGVILILLPSYAAFLLLSSKVLAFLALFVLICLFNFFMGPTLALLQRLAPDTARATTFAVVMLIANLIGMGLGPQLVGVLSDILHPTVGEDALRYGMLIISGTALWAAFHFWAASRAVSTDLAAGR